MIYFQNLCTLLKNNPNYVTEFFQKRHYRRIAFHSATIIAREIETLLEGSGIEIAYMVDDNYKGGLPTISMSATKYPQADVLLIADLMNTEAIRRRMAPYIPFPMISALEILKA